MAYPASTARNASLMTLRLPAPGPTMVGLLGVGLLFTGFAVKPAKAQMQQGLSSDLLAIDIRNTLYHLASITGAVSADDILHSIFSKFCIGK